MPKEMKTGARLNYRIDELLLTTNQKEVAKLLLNGLSFGEIASRLLTSKKSVRGTVEALINKFQCVGLEDLKPKLERFLEAEAKQFEGPEVPGIPFLTDEEQVTELSGGSFETTVPSLEIPVADMTNPRFDASGRVKSGRR
jgi:DNA-binding CsgD family transcriptional regulator